MKKCGRCGLVKRLDEFHTRALSPDRRQSWCKSCAKAWHATSRDRGRNNAYMKARRKALERLAEDHPTKFERFLKEELAKVGVEPKWGVAS
jgi:hypothetical protein